jgi:hypothetical protein
MDNSRWEDPKIRTLSGIVFLAGAWLLISAFAFSYSSSALLWNQFIGGIVIAVLALVRYAARSAVWASWVNALVSAWLIIAVATMSLTASARWCGFIGSIVAFVLALANTASPAPTTHRMHHGHPAM